jgi:hypothetical protein
MEKWFLIGLSLFALTACKNAITSDFATERAVYCQANGSFLRKTHHPKLT